MVNIKYLTATFFSTLIFFVFPAERQCRYSDEPVRGDSLFQDYSKKSCVFEHALEDTTKHVERRIEELGDGWQEGRVDIGWTISLSM